jgi:hypothetical protein
MYKLIGIILAGISAFLFMRALFIGHSKRRAQAFSDFRKQIDYLVWMMLFFIGCGLVYSIVTLIVARG